jgi:uroporphyrinogen decarboxylase
MTPIDPTKANPYVGEALTLLRKEVGNEAAVLGFAGCPFTMATYIVEVTFQLSFIHHH